MLKGRPFVCPTTQVCVQQCPSQSAYYQFNNYQTYRVCTYDVTTNNTNNDQLVRDGKCAPYVLASKPLFGRCIPGALENVVNDFIQVSDRFLCSIREKLVLIFSFRCQIITTSVKILLILMEKR